MGSAMSNAVDFTSEARSASAEELPKLQMHCADAYISGDYTRAEHDKLWREVWLQVGLLEGLPEAAITSFTTVENSVLIVRNRKA